MIDHVEEFIVSSISTVPPVYPNVPKLTERANNSKISVLFKFVGLNVTIAV